MFTRRHPAFRYLPTLLLTACMSAPVQKGQPTIEEARRIEDAVTSAMIQRDPVQAQRELDKALQLYSLVDFQEGRVAVHLKIARLYLQMEQRDLAQQHLSQAMAIGSQGGGRNNYYQSQLLEGRLSDDMTAYERALSVADNAIARAVALTYLGRYQQAFEQVQALQDVDSSDVEDLAFIFYGYARHASELAAAQTALDYYKQADNYLGIADSLFLLARIHQQTGNKMQAREYMQRAIYVSRALGDEFRVTAIEEALRGL